MRRIALILAVLAGGGAAFAASSSAEEESRTYVLEMFNAFGIVEGSEVKVVGVNSGTVQSLEVSEDKTALIEIELTGPLAVLGEDTTCSSEPQSLIAEYFIDCQPKGAPLEDGAQLENKVAQTVQTDLVQNTLREPFKDRLALLINEFGTALAGNPENLNEAIRLGAPALDDLHAALRLLGRQNTVIRDLNVDSDEIIGKLADRRDDVASFIDNAGAAAAASAERSEDLSANFDKLDDFLVELEPTMVELGNVARESTPLLTDLRGAAPQLNELAVSLPSFNRATQSSLVTLGKASIPGKRALDRGVQNGTFQALRDSADQAPRTTELSEGLRLRPRRSAPNCRDGRPRREDVRGQDPSLLLDRPRRPDRLHRVRGPPELRPLPGGFAQPVRQRRPHSSLLALRRVRRPVRQLQPAPGLPAERRRRSGRPRPERRPQDDRSPRRRGVRGRPRSEPAGHHPGPVRGRSRNPAV